MVYLLHYDSPISHAQHYIGFCDDPRRIEKHGNGTSKAHLPQEFHRRGIQFTVARTWDEDRNFERKMKNHKNARRLCPICHPEFLAKSAKRKRERRLARKMPVTSQTMAVAAVAS